jgi:hypothetical protein
MDRLSTVRFISFAIAPPRFKSGIAASQALAQDLRGARDPSDLVRGFSLILRGVGPEVRRSPPPRSQSALVTRDAGGTARFLDETHRRRPDHAHFCAVALGLLGIPLEVSEGIRRQDVRVRQQQVGVKSLSGGLRALGVSLRRRRRRLSALGWRLGLRLSARACQGKQHEGQGAPHALRLCRRFAYRTLPRSIGVA